MLGTCAVVMSHWLNVSKQMHWFFLNFLFVVNEMWRFFEGMRVRNRMRGTRGRKKKQATKRIPCVVREFCSNLGMIWRDWWYSHQMIMKMIFVVCKLLCCFWNNHESFYCERFKVLCHRGDFFVAVGVNLHVNQINFNGCFWTNGLKIKMMELRD